jgi:hypothetical protein
MPSRENVPNVVWISYPWTTIMSMITIMIMITTMTMTTDRSIV